MRLNTKRVNFIQHHIIGRIVNTWIKKTNLLKHDGFLYLDVPPVMNNNKIDRVGRGFIYQQNEIAPLEWCEVPGNILVHILKEMDKNNVYIYKNYENSLFKVRLKNDIK